ncbi:hypothetical protein [Streptomyces chartreusis]|uniref:hypothetical protein n=1 Tax=Streptomyces chartreusis TaxID=1969 RepID=UPI00381AB605
MTEQSGPIRKDLLPCAPPPEWEFHTVHGARTGTDGCALFPGDSGPVVVRRRVTYGDWGPVRPDHWADEPGTATVPAAAPPTDTPLHVCTLCGHTICNGRRACSVVVGNRRCGCNGSQTGQRPPTAEGRRP